MGWDISCMVVCCLWIWNAVFVCGPSFSFILVQCVDSTEGCSGLPVSHWWSVWCVELQPCWIPASLLIKTLCSQDTAAGLHNICLVLWTQILHPSEKTQKISCCRIAAVSGGYLHRFICVWAALNHLSTNVFPCWKLITKSNLTVSNIHWPVRIWWQKNLIHY